MCERYNDSFEITRPHFYSELQGSAPEKSMRLRTEFHPSPFDKRTSKNDRKQPKQHHGQDGLGGSEV